MDPQGIKVRSFMASEKCRILRILVAILNFDRNGKCYLKTCKRYSDFGQLLDPLGTRDYSFMASEKNFEFQPLSLIFAGIENVVYLKNCKR